jgi:hypothetical protein
VELRAVLPKDGSGLTLAELLKMFPGRLGTDAERKKDFIELVKANTAYGKDKLLRAK